MSEQTILVIGATGTVGEPVARHLAADGCRVRLLVRDPAKARDQLGSSFEYIQGSVEDEEAVKQALSGCTGAHLSLQAGSSPADIERVEHLGVRRVVELAAQQHLTRLTYVSGMFVGAEAGSAVLDVRAKEGIEQALRQSGLPFTIFRPTYFMDNLPKHLQGKRAMALGKQPHPLHLVAASDFGRMVSRAFQEPLAANKTFYIQGPEALTLEEALRLYCSLLKPSAKVTTIPLWVMSMADTLFLKKQMSRTLRMMQVLRHTGELGDPSEANRVLGAPTTTLRAWCEQQRLQPSENRIPQVSQTQLNVRTEAEG